MTLRVSVVTLSLDQGRFLERALRSVLNQNHPDIEYIVVDPGSTDGSRSVIERYSAELAHVILEHDAGPADGLNKAFRLSTGEVFAYVNADDALLPGAISQAASLLEADPGLAAVYAHGYIVDEHGAVLRRFRSTRFDARRFVLRGVNVMQQATFVRREPFFAVGGFNTENRSCWDAELLLDLGICGVRLRRVEALWGLFTVHRDSISGSGRLQQLYRLDQRRMFEKVHGRPPTERDRIRFALARVGKWMHDPRYLWWRIGDLARRPADGALQ